MSLKRDLALFIATNTAHTGRETETENGLPFRPKSRDAPLADFDFTDIISQTQSDHCSASELEPSPDQADMPLSIEPLFRSKLRPVVRILNAVAELTFPKSQYMNWNPPLEITPEAEAVALLMIEWRRLQIEDPDSDPNNDVNFELSDFCVYAPERTTALPKKRDPDFWDRFVGGLEMVPLHMPRANRSSPLLFDGVLSCGALSYYVQKVPFGVLSIDGYCDLDKHSVSDDIWIQSTYCERDVTPHSRARPWYCIRQPRGEYLRYHEPFLWIADLGKHFVDYLQDNRENKTDIKLSHFKAAFYDWLIDHHGRSLQFQQWLEAFGKTDFRVVILAHVEHLWTEATNINDKLRCHFIWKEIDPKALSAIPTQVSRCAPLNKTVVTPLVYECFKKIYFASLIETRVVKDPVVKAAQRSRKKALGFMAEEYKLPPSDTLLPRIQLTLPTTLISTGDVVGVSRDVESAWKNTTSETWFAYVRAIHEDERGKYLAVTWLYRPEDTTLSNMTYPFQNELFMSDHCNCGERTFRVEEVTCQLKINWYPHQIPAPNQYFVRQKYCSKDQTFVTIKPKDFYCTCDETTNAFTQVTKQYKIQNTVLIEWRHGQSKRLEPVVIVDFMHGTQQIQVRRLLRTHEAINGNYAPNQLIWTDQLMTIAAKSIKRQCQVRFALPTDDIPSLYKRGGQADLFLVTHRLIRQKEERKIYLLDRPLPGPMTEGLDFGLAVRRSPMKLLSLFSGGGNFDRGLEEGGCICTNWAVEWDPFAAHTYRANCKDPDATQIFLGSVDEFLARAIDGETSKLIPMVGEVDCICGGSPCQGFSQMQPNTQSVQSMTNASKVASVAAYIDHYRPSYALLENVVSMTRPLGPRKENVFSQMLCALVAMGYQVQQFNLDSWSFGDAQSRSRLFIAITAPGLIPMPHPPLTHSHPPGKANRNLGRAVNGEAFGERCFHVTPFSFVTAREATKDLPPIGDGHVLACIPFPDHRQYTRQRLLIRIIMKLIPTTPPGMNLARTQKLYTVPAPVREYFDRQHSLRKADSSNSLCRVVGDGLFPTVVTKLVPDDGKAGRGLHWDQPRTQTLLEARRAQGFLDYEPLIGLVSAQWKIVGNSVARSVSLALGISLREAWLGNTEYLMLRVTTHTETFSSPIAREARLREVTSTAKLKPIVLITTNISFDRSEYDSYSDCEIDSEEWTGAEMSDSSGVNSSEPASLGEACRVDDRTEVDDVITDVLGPLLEDEGALAEVTAQAEVAIEPVVPSENWLGGNGNPDSLSRPKKVARM